MAINDFNGINVRGGARFLHVERLTDSYGTLIVSGTASISVAQIETDGTLTPYDFSDNTFKALPVTATASMTHIQWGGVNTGIWSYILATTVGLTTGAMYLIRVEHTSLPLPVISKIQFGGAEGTVQTDLTALGVQATAIKVKTDQMVFISDKLKAHISGMDDLDFTTTQKATLAATPITLTAAYDAAKTAAQAGGEMTLTAAYDAAKTAAQAGEQMDLVNTPNSTAITALQNGLVKMAQTVDGSTTVAKLYEILLAMVVGKATDNGDNTVTVFKQDGLATSYRINLTATQRTRLA